MAAMVSGSQSQKVSDCELCFGGHNDSYPRQLLFLNMGRIDSFLTLSVVKCIRQNILNSRKASFVSHFLFHGLLPKSLPSELKCCVQSSKSMSGPHNLSYEREWWMAGNNKSMIQTERNIDSLKLSPQEALESAVPASKDMPVEIVRVPAKVKHMPRHTRKCRSGKTQHLILYFLFSFPPSPQGFMSECLP